MTTRIGRWILLLLLVCSISFAGACDSSSGNGESASPKTPSAGTAGSTAGVAGSQEYFPIAVGNRWVYRRNVVPGREPLYYFEFTVEKQGSGFRPAGTTSARSGREVSLLGGVETYEVVRAGDGGFVIVASEGHGLEPYKLAELHELVWGIKNWSGDVVIWESRRGLSLGSIGRSSQVVGLLSTDISLSILGEGRKITCAKHTQPIAVPAGTFTDVIRNTIEFKGGIGPEDLTIERFFAAGVGLVKETQRDGQGNHVYTVELLTYEVR